MTKVILSLVCVIQMAVGGPPTESYKDQYCTDPRTMRKHAAYTEWADAYSCTRHRCQPGGRNLAIYTVGCKRVEAPESAIECEEVVEDTNMQFPYCCTRLRCLVVVRGEVWTRVLGQPWEALPAAPWSHMYKMKRPPPADGSFLPKTPEVGPVYELAETEKQDKVLRASDARDSTDCNEVKPAVAPAPDIVIALSTNPKEQHKSSDEGSGRLAPRYLALSAGAGHRRQHKAHAITTPAAFFDEGGHESDTAIDIEEFPKAVTTEKPAPVVMRSGDGEASSDEKYFANSFGVTQKIKTAPKSDHWTEIPNNQWNEHDPLDADSKLAADHDQDMTWTLPDASTSKDPLKEPPPSNLQALVDAIGTRMRDIESVVQQMSDKVQDAAPQQGSEEKRPNSDAEVHSKKKPLKPAPDSDQYKRFSERNRGSKYLRTSEPTTDIPLFLDDNHIGAGYFSDASNTVLRRASGPKEPAQTYMAPVETRRKPTDSLSDDESDKKHKKHSHKKKKSKRGHKKHHSKDEKRKRFNKISSAERENIVSLEDSSVMAKSTLLEYQGSRESSTSLVVGQTHARKIGKDLGLGCEHKVHKLLLRRYIKQFHQHARKLWLYLENTNR